MAINFLNTVAVDDSVLFVDTTNDRVGIGTDSPSATLDVVGSGLSTMLRLSNTEANATTKYGAILGRHYTNAQENVTGMLITSSSNSLTGQTVSIGGGISSANAVNEIKFYTAANNTTLTGTERMRIGSTGKVGIGTTSPLVELEVDGSIMASGTSGASFRLNSNTISGVNNSIISTSQNNSTPPQGSISWQAGQYGGASKWSTRLHNAPYTTSYINLPHSSVGGNFVVNIESVDRLTIDRTNGNVGIGTTSPSEKLEVSEGFILSSGASTNHGFELSRDSADTYQIRHLDGGLTIFNSTDSRKEMTFKGDGNVGIGTSTPDAKLSVVGATSTNDLIGGSINLAASSGWVIPSGAMSTRVGYYGGNFTLNGLAAENGMEWGLGPFNDRQLLWTTTGSTDSNQDGGWNKTLTNLDIESPYLSVVYFRRVSSNSSGNFYHGTGNNILNLDGTSNVNPYFTVRALSGFDQNVWYASVGVIQSNSDSNTTAYADVSGLYRLDTGVKVANSNAFKFASTGATLTRGHRTYLYYSTDTSVVAQFANPGFYKIDGDQPKLHDILGGDNDDVFWSANGNDIYNDNSGNVGIGTTSPGAKLDVVGPTLGNTSGDTAIAAQIKAGRQNIDFKNFRTADENDWNDATFKIQARIDSTVHQSINFVNDASYNEHIDIYTGNQVFNTRFNANGNVGIGTTSPGAKLEVSSGLGTGSDGVFIKDPFAGTSRTANSKNPILSLGTSTENGSTATIFMGANATPTNQDSKIEFNRTGGYLSIWYKGQGTYREHVRYGNPASSTPRSAFFGNVGIGTTSPGVALDVNGEIAIRGGEGVDDARMYFRASDNSNRFTIETDLDGSTSNDLLGFRAIGTDNILVLKGNGNVGIGTTSPESNLEISDSTQATGATLSITNAHNGSWATGDKIGSIDFRIDDTSTTQPVRAKIHTEGKTTGTYPSSSQLVFSTANVNTLYERMRIDSAGNVGIGDTSPSFPLSVNGTSAANRFYVPNVTATTAWAFQAKNSANTADSGLYFENGDAQLLLRDDSNNLNVRINADTNSYINGGSLGLGTTSPNLKLDVISGTNNGIRISATDTTSNWRDIDIRSYVSQAQANALPDGSAIYTTNPASQTETAFSKFGGLVLQGRDDGNSSFAIRLGNGNGYATRMFMGATGATVFSNTVTATNFILSSDERLKENVEKVCDNRVKADWKTFELKTEKGEKRYGVIAQELEENHPEFVKTDDEGFKSVKYIDLLIAKIAELEARLEKLEK